MEAWMFRNFFFTAQLCKESRDECKCWLYLGNSPAWNTASQCSFRVSVILGWRLRVRGGACPPGSGMFHSQETHLQAVTGTHFWSHDWGRKVRMEISEWKDSTVPVILPEGYLFIFDVDHFKSLYWICCNIVSILCFDFGLRGMWNLSYLTRMAAGLAPVLNLHPWHWKVKFCVFFFLTFLFCTGV